MARLLNPPFRSPGGKRAGTTESWICSAFHTDIDNAAELIVTEGTYAQLATASVAELVSSQAADITQIATVHGIDANGNRQSEAITLTGTDTVQGSLTFTYIENFYLNTEAAGNITLQHSDNTDVNIIPANQLSADVVQHFTGECWTYLNQWWAELYYLTGAANDDILFELRWYPDDADCLDTGDGYAVIDRINIKYDSTATQALMRPSGIKVFKPALVLPPGGWLAVFGLAGAANMDGVAGMQGIDVVPTSS